MFDNGDVENGELRTPWEEKGLMVMKPLEGGDEMTRAFDQSCQIIVEACRRGAYTLI